MTGAREGYLLGGRYRIGAEIGRGGMGTVWDAHDTLLDRPVAAKEIRFSVNLDDDQRVELTRLAIEEARSAARLTHPSIVAVYDVIADDGRPWIVMQRVAGQSLEQAVATGGPWAPTDVARIGIDILNALEVAHAAGIIHRDVKPSNVLVGPGGAGLLTDFSIARAVGAGTMTNTGMVMGSPGYIAPERIAHGQVTPAADLFGLGATLFFAVEGRGPFDAADSMAAAFAAAIHPHPRPEHAGALTPVIDGLLEKDPRNRLGIGDARSMLGDIIGTSAVPAAAPPVQAPPASAPVLPIPAPPIPAPIVSAPLVAAPPVPAPAVAGPPTPAPPPPSAPVVASAPLNWGTSGVAADATVSSPANGDAEEPRRGRGRLALIIGAVVIVLVLAGAGIAQALAHSPAHPAAGPSPTAVVSSAVVSSDPGQPITESTPSPTPAASDTPSTGPTTPPPATPSQPPPEVVKPKVTAVTVAVAKGSIPNCQATITATVHVSAGPVTVTLSTKINGTNGSKTVTFGSGGAQTKQVNIGTAGDDAGGTAHADATAPNSVSSTTRSWSAVTACLHGFTVSEPHISCKAGGGLTITITIALHQFPSDDGINVEFIVSGADDGNAGALLDPQHSQTVSGDTQFYTTGSYEVYTKSSDGNQTITSATQTGSCIDAPPSSPSP